ncbi:type IV pilus modification protein PilV, partial [Pseudomonas aeruginosa]|uniref:type IV pilus modification protein PilV n=1 Tax=Pseudomonas aeruginosa TaxID=287 RepID=UPI001069A3A7
MSRETGFSMIEVLVALVLISIGVLGMVAMQGRTIQYTQESVQRNAAAMLASDLMEIMRADPDAVLNLRAQLREDSVYYKAKGSDFPAAPARCAPLPADAKERLGCWAQQASKDLPGAFAL